MKNNFKNLGFNIMGKTTFINKEQSKTNGYAELGDVWEKAQKPLSEYAIGTKAKAQGGGYWIKNNRGWKWCTGATFSNVGGDWTGEICKPT